jgi:diacylglycerol O-acyltransferase/trehalose O-mycolyltransferase
MRVGKPRVSQTWRRRLVGMGAAALVMPMAAGLIGGAAASAAPSSAISSPAVHAQASYGDRLQRHNVYSAAMGRNIPVDVLRSSNGGSGALYLLDGLRARDDVSGWQLETNALDMFADSNVNVVLPIGGRSSFYADWINDAKPGLKYKWETFLTNELPGYLSGLGIRSTNNAVVGISMAGSAALKLAADHKPLFSYAGSMSGYLNLSAPGMPSLVGLALLDEGGFNANDMFGPPGAPAWGAHDPTVFAAKLAGVKLFISAGSAIPGQYTRIQAPIDLAYTVNGMGLEAVSLLNTRTFQGRATALGLNATYHYPALGIHAWGYWQDALSQAKPGILATLGA